MLLPVRLAIFFLVFWMLLPPTVFIVAYWKNGMYYRLFFQFLVAGIVALMAAIIPSLLQILESFVVAMVKRLVTEEFFFTIWKWFRKEEYITVSNELANYVKLTGIRRIGKVYYIQNLYGVWIQVDRPCMSEDGTSVISLKVDGTRKILNDRICQPMSITKDDWIQQFSCRSNDFNGAFFRRLYLSRTELMAYDLTEFDHIPPKDSTEQPVYCRMWLKVEPKD